MKNYRFLVKGVDLANGVWINGAGQKNSHEYPILTVTLGLMLIRGCKAYGPWPYRCIMVTVPPPHGYGPVANFKHVRLYHMVQAYTESRKELKSNLLCFDEKESLI